MNIASDINLINSTIKWILKDTKLHICIHDLTGIFHNADNIRVQNNYSIHSSEFCEQAKTTSRGLKLCLKCKELSLKKALSTKSMYMGKCYLGISEIIQPVLYNNKPICVIYLGNIAIKDNLQSIIKNMSEVCTLTGVEEDKIIKKINTTEIIENSSITSYIEIIKIIEGIILQAIGQNIKLNRKTISTLPSYRSTNNWVIESIQNYILTYYNRDLKLCQFSKLYFLNQQYLCRLFKKETGTNFSDYVNSVRVNKAKLLLTETEYNIVDIALEIGYKNVTYFNRLFKRYTGKTPKEYRLKAVN